MLLDVLKLIAPDSSWASQNGLAMAKPGKTSDHTMWTYLDSDKLVYIKGAGGFPWDWLTYDEQFIRMLLTENVWSNPATGKLDLFTGIPRFPRYIDYSPNQQGVASITLQFQRPRTDYIIINADGSASASDDGVVICNFSGPYSGADILDSNGNVIIPAGEDWLHSYKWKTTTEHIKHRAPVGRYYWDSTDSSGNITASSMAVGIVNQPCPTPMQKIW